MRLQLSVLGPSTLRGEVLCRYSMGRRGADEALWAGRRVCLGREEQHPQGRNTTDRRLLGGRGRAAPS
jgi:hypothetical protein